MPEYSDYLPEAPGGRPAGASSSRCRSTPRLGAELARLHPPYTKAPSNVVVMHQDYFRDQPAEAPSRGMLRSLRVGARNHVGEARPARMDAMGNARSRPLRIGLRDAGVPVELDTALSDLVVEDGRVRGV